MLRRRLNLTLKDRVKNEDVRMRVGTQGVSEKVERLKFKYTGHVARINEERWHQRTVNWEPYDLKRRKGRPAVRWRDELGSFVLGTNWQKAAQNRSAGRGSQSPDMPKDGRFEE